MKYTIGVDFGGSASKATLLREDGQVIATSTQEYPAYHPELGWFEQDAEDFYGAFAFNIKKLFEKSGVDNKEIAAIALDAATHTAILCDENDKPIRRAIHWSDARSTKEVAELHAEHDALMKKYCCNNPSAAWTLPHLMWLRKHEPENFAKIRRIYFVKDYVRHQITGDFVTDDIEAMGAILVDDYGDGKHWCKELCDFAGVKPEYLPEIKRPMDIAGYVTKKVADETGLREGTPVIVGTTDTVLEVYAAGAIELGNSTVKLATAGRICPITDKAIPSHQFFNYRHVVDGLWYPGTGTRSCAASYTWYRNTFGDAEELLSESKGKPAYRLLDEAAEETPVGAEGLFFHPYLLGEMTPYYDDSLRGSFTGIDMHHTKGHFSRAVMEGVAYSLKDCLEVIKEQGVVMRDCRIIGGGAKSPMWRQMVSDMFNLPLYYTKSNDSSLGAAMLAGVATGMFASFKESVDKCVEIIATITPIEKNVEIYDKGFKTYKAIQKSLADVYHTCY